MSRSPRFAPPSISITVVSLFRLPESSIFTLSHFCAIVVLGHPSPSLLLFLSQTPPTENVPRRQNLHCLQPFPEYPHPSPADHVPLTPLPFHLFLILHQSWTNSPGVSVPLHCSSVTAVLLELHLYCHNFAFRHSYPRNSVARRRGTAWRGVAVKLWRQRSMSAHRHCGRSGTHLRPSCPEEAPLTPIAARPARWKSRDSKLDKLASQSCYYHKNSSISVFIERPGAGRTLPSRVESLPFRLTGGPPRHSLARPAASREPNFIILFIPSPSSPVIEPMAPV